MFDVKFMLKAALFSALTVILSFIRIPLPFSPVPVTGQTFGTMMSALFLGKAGGALSMVVYVLVGFVGMPVFGGIGGPAVLMGPTGGYLWGMILGAFVIGWLAQGRDGFWALFAACVVGGVLVVYVPGIYQLARVSGMDLKGALVVGALPYLFGDALKCTAAAGAAARLDFFREPA